MEVVSVVVQADNVVRFKSHKIQLFHCTQTQRDGLTKRVWCCLEDCTLYMSSKPGGKVSHVPALPHHYVVLHVE